MQYPPAAVFQNEKATSLQPGGPIISGMPELWCITLHKTDTQLAEMHH
jgi:hypothetical protein